MNNKNILNAVITLIAFFLSCNALHAQAAKKIMAEKINFNLPNKMLHKSIHDKSKPSSEIQVIIPTDLNTDDAWAFRGWSSDFIDQEAVSLLELAISFGANQFVLSSECLLKSSPENLEKIKSYCNDYKITLLAKSPKFGMPINASDLEILTAVSQSKLIKGIIFDFKGDFVLDEAPTHELLQLLLSRIANKDLKIISNSFGIPLYFNKAVSSLKLASSIQMTARNPSLVAELNPQIQQIEGEKIVTWDASLSEYGQNQNIAVLSDYIGYRMTQLLSLEKQPSGVLIDFGNSITPFGTINEINNYCVNQLMLSKKKDVDFINYEWFTAKFGEKSSVKIWELLANSINVIRKTNYIAQLDYPLMLRNEMVSPITLLQNSELKKWLPTSQQKEPLRSWAYRDKLSAKEIIKQINEETKHFDNIPEIKNAKDLNHLIKSQQETTAKALAWTELLLTAMTNKISKDNPLWQKYSNKYKEDLEKTYLKDFVEIFINGNPDYIDLIPEENKPVYLVPNEQKEN